MKTLHRTCAAAILCMALAVSVFAGQIETPGAPSPPSPPSPSGSTNIMATAILTIIGLIR